MSTGGVYRTADGGDTWQASNTGIRAYFMPDEYPEFGQCVHKVAAHPGRPEQFFAQNHHGVYRSDDGGATWASIADGLPTDFGFAMVAHPHRPGVVYNFPLEADSAGTRRRRGAASTAARTRARPGRRSRRACPTEPFYPTRAARRHVRGQRRDRRRLLRHPRRRGLRQRDEGEHWQQIAAHLPEVLCVRAAVV